MTITGTPKEIADLVLLLQNRQKQTLSAAEIAKIIGSTTRDMLAAVR